MKPHGREVWRRFKVKVCSDGIKRNTIIHKNEAEVRKTFLNSFTKNKKTECWDWVGYSNGSESIYGAIWRDGKLIKAHRYSYEIHCGKIPPGKIIRHKCDNRLCVNPDHLIAGTHKENMADMKERGRSNHIGMPGTKNGNALMNDEVVREIIRLKKSGRIAREISAILGFKKTTISSVLEGRAWRHVTGLKHPDTRKPKAFSPEPIA